MIPKLVKVLRLAAVPALAVAFFVFAPVGEIAGALGLTAPAADGLSQSELRRLESKVAWQVELADGVRPLDVQCSTGDDASEYSCGVQDSRTSLYEPLTVVVEGGAGVDVFRPKEDKIKTMTSEEARAKRAEAAKAAAKAKPAESK